MCRDAAEKVNLLAPTIYFVIARRQPCHKSGGSQQGSDPMRPGYGMAFAPLLVDYQGLIVSVLAPTKRFFEGCSISLVS